jgi:hypothetical protein
MPRAPVNRNFHFQSSIRLAPAPVKTGGRLIKHARYYWLLLGGYAKHGKVR